MAVLGGKGEKGYETSDMTSVGLGEMFEGHSADMCARNFPLISMGGQAEGLACADPGARTPIGASGNFNKLSKNDLLVSSSTMLVFQGYGWGTHFTLTYYLHCCRIPEQKVATTHTLF